MKRSVFILVLMFCLLPLGLQAQDVTLISTGDGANKELAVKNALLSAIEQAYGAYVSGNTVILNDELIRDEVVQIKRGNVKNYTILNEAQLGGNIFSVILEATVSTDNLLKFAESKGATCELAGKSFAANLKLYKMYVRNGAEAMKHLYNMLGWLAPKIYDYKLNLGSPIVYKSDVYIPVAVDCVLNDSYATFLDLYTSTNNSIVSSINSVPIKGDTNDENMLLIGRYRDYIHKLPELWAFGFLIRDNLDNFVIPILNAYSDYVRMPENAFWPGIKKYKIGTNHYDDDYIYGLAPHTYITYKKDIVFKANGVKIQKLDYEPLCSLNENERGGNVLRDYVKGVEDKMSAFRAFGHTGVYDIRYLDSRMVDWLDGDDSRRAWHGVMTEFPTPASVGEKVCTVHFFLCYKDADIEKVSDINVQSIMKED